MANEKQSLTAKLVTLGATFVAAWAAQQVITIVWKKTLGHTPPKHGDDSEASFAEIATATAVSGALVAFAQVAATRSAAKYMGRRAAR